jgi:hypothetical protein
MSCFLMINIQCRWLLAVILGSVILLLRNRPLLDHGCFCWRFHAASKSGRELPTTPSPTSSPHSPRWSEWDDLMAHSTRGPSVASWCEQAGRLCSRRRPDHAWIGRTTARSGPVPGPSGRQSERVMIASPSPNSTRLTPIERDEPGPVSRTTAPLRDLR